MKKKNAWLPAVLFVISLGLLIAGLSLDGERGETGLLIGAGVSFVLAGVSYASLKS